MGWFSSKSDPKFSSPPFLPNPVASVNTWASSAAKP